MADFSSEIAENHSTEDISLYIIIETVYIMYIRLATLLGNVICCLNEEGLWIMKKSEKAERCMCLVRLKGRHVSWNIVEL